MTHWKKHFDYNYFGSYVLEPGQELTVTIESLQMEEVTDPHDNGKKTCFVAHFAEEDIKPMILNKTNCSIIESMYGAYTENWVGEKLTLYVKKVRAFGTQVDAVRVRDKKPALPELTPDHSKWAGAKQALKDGNVTIEQIKSKFKLTKANQEQLCK